MPGSRSRYRRRRARLRRWLARPAPPPPAPPPAPVAEPQPQWQRDSLGNPRRRTTPEPSPGDERDRPAPNIADLIFAAVLRSNHHEEKIPDGEAAAVLCSGRGAGGHGVLVYKFATLAEAIAANSSPCPNPRCASTHVVAWRANRKLHTRSPTMRQRNRADEFLRAYPVPVDKGYAPPPETWATPAEYNEPLDTRGQP